MQYTSESETFGNKTPRLAESSNETHVSGTVRRTQINRALAEIETAAAEAARCEQEERAARCEREEREARARDEQGRGFEDADRARGAALLKLYACFPKGFATVRAQ